MLTSDKTNSALASRALDYATIVEVTVDRPADVVWPHFIGDKKNVWTRSNYTTVAGESGQVGEIYTHTHRVHGVQAFYETIRIEPQRQLVLKITCRGSEDDEARLMGYDFVTFKEVDARTTVTFQQALVLTDDGSDTAFEARILKQDQRLTELFCNLKAVVEGAES